jgi:hypothetical protein
MDPATLKQDLLQARFQAVMPQVRWQMARLGNAGKIGIGLLVVAIIFFLLAVLPQETKLDELKQLVENIQIPVNQLSSDESTRKIGGDQALQIYYDFFPRIDSSPFWIRELVKIAKKQGVEINSSDYRLVHEQGARLARYEMILPVRGRYKQIRAFMAEALEAIPAMAVTGMVIKREHVQTEQLDVRLEIDLYLDEL